MVSSGLEWLQVVTSGSEWLQLVYEGLKVVTTRFGLFRVVNW